MGGHSKEDARRLEWATLNLERGVVGGGGETTGYGNASLKPAIGLVRLFSACMVSGGIQYGWALQLSLLSPYSQARSVISSLFFDVCFARIYMQYGWLIFSRNFHGLIDL